MRPLYSLLPLVALLLLAGTAAAQPSFITFESGQVRPIALSPDGSQVFAVNTPDNRLEIFSVTAGSLTHTGSVPVGMEPVAVAARNNNEVWVVNHLSDSISVIDLSSTPARVARTLLVGDEPRDIVFAGTGGNRAFITTAHRGQHRTDSSIFPGVTGAGDPQLTESSGGDIQVGRADVWVFDATSLSNTLGGTPDEILTFFADTPRALATSPDGNTVYVAAHFSGNQTTVINETVVPDGFFGACNGNGTGRGVPNPDDNVFGDGAPESGLILKFVGNDWVDALGCTWNNQVAFDLPDHDVFSINANTLNSNSVEEFDHVGTTLFNMAVNPQNGKIYVTNIESPNHIRFEGPGNHGISTVQGHLSESRVTVIDPAGPSVEPQHLNPHIDYSQLHTDGGANHAAINAQIPHSLATPVQPVVTSNGNTLYVAAFGSAKIGVFDTSDIEDPNFENNFDPTVESANYISTGGGPSGIALDEANGRLYVLTRFGNQVEVINTANGNTLETHPLHNPEPAHVVTGRPHLYDAVNTSGNGEASCSSCHIFGDMDQLGWNLGNPDDATSINNQPSATPLLDGQKGTTFHPMKGPMTTQTLRGMATHGAMHWRGDRLDGFFGTDACNQNASQTAPCDEEHSFKNFIVAFEGLIGHEGLISNSDMQEFNDFMLEVVLPPNPVRNLDNSLNSSGATSQQTGANFFGNFERNIGGNPPTSDTVEPCDGCHDLDPSKGFFGSGGSQTFEGESQTFKVAHMRNLYAKVGMFQSSGDQVRGFGFLHDGSVDTLFRFVSASVFTGLTTDDEREAVENYSLAFPTDLAPIVGQQVTLTSTNSGAVGSRIDLMIQRAGTNYNSLMLGGNVPECELVVKGSVGGTPQGWVRESGGLFRDDHGNTMSDAALRNLASSEGPLTYTCAPPGSGQRMGIDRDEDTLLDGVETDTGVFVNGSDTGTSPASADTDNDGFDDDVEVAAGTDPNDPLEFPGSPPVADLPALSPAAYGTLVALVALAGGAGLRRRRWGR